MRRTGESFSLKLLFYAIDDAREEATKPQSLGLAASDTQANLGQVGPVNSYGFVGTVLYILAVLAYFGALVVPVYRYGWPW